MRIFICRKNSEKGFWKVYKKILLSDRTLFRNESEPSKWVHKGNQSSRRPPSALPPICSAISLGKATNCRVDERRSHHQIPPCSPYTGNTLLCPSTQFIFTYTHTCRVLAGTERTPSWTETEHHFFRFVESLLALAVIKKTFV